MLFVQQLVDDFDIVQRVVAIEDQLGYSPELEANALAEVVSNGLLVGFDSTHQLVRLFGGENTEVDLGHTQIRTDAHGTQRDECHGQLVVLSEEEVV